jgi:ATP-binding cassette subfamily B protein
MRGGPMAGMMGAPPAKSKNFKGSLRRLLSELKPERHILISVLVLITSSVTIGAFGPKILGRATNEIFNGFIGSKLPRGLTKDQIVTSLRMQGEKTQADMLAKSSVIPGHGINFSTISHFLYLAIALYAISSLMMWVQAYLMAGVTQRTVNRLRRLA